MNEFMRSLQGPEPKKEPVPKPIIKEPTLKQAPETKKEKPQAKRKLQATTNPERDMSNL